MSEPQVIPAGTIINNYQIINLIGAGGYAGIYKVKNIKTNQFYAMKTENIDSEIKTLPIEINIMEKLNEDYFPKLRDSGINQKYNINYLVMDIYGVSIDTIQLYHHKQLDSNTVYSVCYMMLQIIQAFHSHDYIHRDIKPSNFLIQNKKNYPLVLIDFGISQKHIDPSTNKPFQFKKKDKFFAGTTRYASIAACQGSAYGRRDDLISLFYSFLDLTCGFLPWDSTTDFSEMLFMKQFLNLSCLNATFPKEIKTLYKYIRKLRYNQEPRYEYVNQLFLKAMEANRIRVNDFNWGLFYSKHSNLEVFARELSLHQIKMNYQKSKIDKKEGKHLKKTASTPLKIRNDADAGGSGLKSLFHFHLVNLIKSKSDSMKKANKNSPQSDFETSNYHSVDNKNGNHAVDISLHDNEKSKSARKRPPIIPKNKKL